jgi:hypothetical protein
MLVLNGLSWEIERFKSCKNHFKYLDAFGMYIGDDLVEDLLSPFYQMLNMVDCCNYFDHQIFSNGKEHIFQFDDFRITFWEIGTPQEYDMGDYSHFLSSYKDYRIEIENIPDARDAHHQIVNTFLNI